MARPRASIDTEALARAFAADGLHGTPIARVAADLGLAKPTLYARGGEKEELFALAVETEVERLLDRFESPRVSDLARALDAHPRAGLRLVLVTGRCGEERVERALDRVRDALRAAVGPALGAALLGGAYAALFGGPPVVELARMLPAPAESPPRGTWTA